MEHVPAVCCHATLFVFCVEAVRLTDKPLEQRFRRRDDFFLRSFGARDAVQIFDKIFQRILHCHLKNHPEVIVSKAEHERET